MVLAAPLLRHASLLEPRLEIWPRGKDAFIELCRTLERIGCDRGSAAHVGACSIDREWPPFCEERGSSPDARRARQALQRVRQRPRHVAESIVELVGAVGAPRSPSSTPSSGGSCRGIGRLWRRTTDDAERLGLHVGHLGHLTLSEDPIEGEGRASASGR